MLGLILFLALSCDFCGAQDFYSGFNETEDYIEATDCIRHYNDLEAYVKNNKMLIEKLAEAFFTTGRVASKFVKITYNFQTSDGAAPIEEDSIVECFDQQTTYVWSETALYLLGPKPLFWSTLFAVNIPEVDVSIELPCLCNDVYNSLLSRLTYLIKVYAAAKYHDNHLQYANKYYFEVKSTMNEENYKTIVVIMMLMAVLPLILMCAVSPLTVLNTYPLIFRLMLRNKVMVDPGIYPDASTVQICIEKGKKDTYKKLTHLMPLTFTSAGISIGFLTVHIYSLLRFVQYGNEVLSGNHGKSHPLPITHAVLSLLAIVVAIGLSIIVLALRITKKDQKQKKDSSKSNTINSESKLDENFEAVKEKRCQIMLTATLVSVNIIYLGCYFLPYILLAFINDPMLSIYTYVMVALFTVSIYMVCLGVWRICKFIMNYNKYDGIFKVAKTFDTVMYFCSAWAIASSLLIFLFATIYLITLGGVDDFEELQNLTPPLLIALVGLILFKPVCKFVTKQVEFVKSNDSSKIDTIKRKKSTATNANDTTILVPNEHVLEDQMKIDTTKRKKSTATNANDTTKLISNEHVLEDQKEDQKHDSDK